MAGLTPGHRTLVEIIEEEAEAAADEEEEEEEERGCGFSSRGWMYPFRRLGNLDCTACAVALARFLTKANDVIM